MADADLKIKKIKLSDGNVYTIFDKDALRLNENNQLVTGDTLVDEIIIQTGLYITEIDDVPVADSIDNVLVQGSNGLIRKRTTEKLLEDIGGASFAMNDSTHVLSLKIGK